MQINSKHRLFVQSDSDIPQHILDRNGEMVLDMCKLCGAAESELWEPCTSSLSDKIYIVTAYRWGDRENHSYVIGVFTSAERALEEAAQEEENRGGKYVCEIIETMLDSGTPPRRQQRAWNGIQFVKKLDDITVTQAWIKERMKKQ